MRPVVSGQNSAFSRQPRPQSDIALSKKGNRLFCGEAGRSWRDWLGGLLGHLDALLLRTPGLI
jgi:hypothetical protein